MEITFCHYRFYKVNETVAIVSIQPWFFEALKPGDFFERKLGIAKCNPEDNFCKKTGREIAIKNMKNTKLTVESIYQDIKEKLIVMKDDSGRRYNFIKYPKASSVFLIPPNSW